MSTESNALKRTPLYTWHQQAGARFTEFGGWEMPVQYSGLTQEHLAVRKSAGLFDVSHMGEIICRGAQAFEALQYLTSNDIAKLKPGRAQYSLLLNEQGGVVDDIIVYQLGENDYLLCVNAANTEKDFAWVANNNSFDAQIENVSSTYAQIALQGPSAREIAGAVFSDVDFSAETFKPFDCKDASAAGELESLIACTGYTGEDGFEFFCRPEQGAELWQRLFEAGQTFEILPVGLGARDTLRLEVCYPLHGHELRDDISALTSGVGWVVAFDKGDFIGRDALKAEKEAGISQKLVGLEVVDSGIIRNGVPLFDEADKEIGWVTSGTKPPTVGKAVGLGIVQTDSSKIGTTVFAEVRGRRLQAKVVKKPFYKRSS